MKFKLSGAYGELSEIRDMQPHTGIDLAMPEGTPLRSIAEGVVERIVDYGAHNIGKGVIVRLKDGNAAIYGHMSEIQVERGQAVNAGDLLGASGNTGHSTGPHLHFGIQQPDGTFLDPTPLAEHISSMSAMTVNTGFMDRLGGWFLERGKVNSYNDVVKEDPNWLWSKVSGSIGSGIEQWCIDAGQWFLLHLPDIMGYCAFLTAAGIVIGAMVGKGGMMKPIAFYAIALIISICLLS